MQAINSILVGTKGRADMWQTSYASQFGAGNTALNEFTHIGDGNIKGNKMLETSDCSNYMLEGPNGFLSAQVGLKFASDHAPDM